ncbi:MAG TPA: HAD hydrolase-like protein [Gaiellaceae bacterium]
MTALRQARGFVLDLDGTLIQRTRSGHEPIVGARELLEAIRRSGRPFVVFTNASHVAPQVLAAELRDGGLDVRDDEVITPVCCAISVLGRRPGAGVLAFCTNATHERLAAAGIRLVGRGEEFDVVLVAHPKDVDFAELEQAARGINAGARLLTASYVAAYSGADGPIFSRGAMVTAALAKVTGARPAIVGKPSRPAVREIVARLGLPANELAVIGDDVALDIALGNLGGSHTVLVRTGITGNGELGRLPKLQRPGEVVGGVGELLERL